jgi:Rps23 Pro-64 3,4-dihydroxylase Tpa1-like proline 4-hydroxylase
LYLLFAMIQTQYLVFLWIILSFACFDSAKAQWWKRIIERLKKDADEDIEDGWKDPVVIESFLSASEALHLLETYKPLLRESLHKTASSQVKRSIYRTSHTVRLPQIGDPLVMDIEQRAAQLAGYNHSHVEDFQLACYGPGELYGLHRDEDAGGAANRAATVLIYLQSPESGGSTLFTKRPLELEKDLDTKQKLTTEKGAIKLFKHYCAKKRHKRHIVVPAIAGNAVVWQNWINDKDKYAARSTHGACPVTTGEKCVIQQWISRIPTNPLRNHTVLAIYPLGADLSFARKDKDSEDPYTCAEDVSAHRQGEPLCTQQPSTLQAIPDGPYPNIGAVRIVGESPLQTKLIQHEGPSTDLTLSFWARNIPVGTTLVTLGGDGGGDLTVTMPNTNLLLLGKSASVELPDSDWATKDWLWISLTVRDAKFLELTVFSPQSFLAGAQLELQDASCQAVTKITLLQPPTQTLTPDQTNGTTAFVRNPNSEKQIEPFAEVSFVVIHNSALDQNQIGNLRQQTRRYDISM